MKATSMGLGFAMALLLSMGAASADPALSPIPTHLRGAVQALHGVGVDTRDSRVEAGARGDEDVVVRGAGTFDATATRMVQSMRSREILDGGFVVGAKARNFETGAWTFTLVGPDGELRLVQLSRGAEDRPLLRVEGRTLPDLRTQAHLTR